ncbi:M43 family zinc metalloprotease [Aquimarina pacifica]|uniref:M43 family zinc metalloprotease n=1 Tax=Aquimarina pacifica TaxID=1296415 RepID=UPI0004728F26|nr:M43 family zinc metalloprotease [Aquimarina pacifica]
MNFLIPYRITVILILLITVLFSCTSDDAKEDLQIASDIYKLPIVIHIIHLGEPIGEGNNLAQNRIMSQVQILNNDFRKKEGTSGYNTHILGADTKIEFILAEITPEGNPTNGIHRINASDIEIDSDNAELPFDWLTQYSYWNPDNYINIWVLPVAPQNLFLGSSTFPTTDLPGLENELQTKGDGILINTPHFGESNISGNANLGRTLTHEMGHFFGLEHLWGKRENTTCGEYDDYCDDTPPVTKRSKDCVENIFACNEEIALINNYMDYTADSCMNMFTNDQVTRMRYVLENADRRKSLIISSAISR